MPQIADDFVEIQNLKARYCETVDRGARDPEGLPIRLAEIFAEDAIGDYGTGLLEGRAAIIEFLMTQICAPLDWLFHALHTPRIEIDGDSATGHWTVIAQSRAIGTDSIETLIGRYQDSFRRTSSGWRIASIRGRPDG